MHQRAGGGERRLLRPGRPADRRPPARRAAARRRLELRGRRTARRGRRSTPRSACWKPCSNTNWPAGAAPEVTEARLRGQEYLLERRLFRRRSTGEVIERIARAAPLDALRLPDLVALRRAAGARVPAPSRRHAGRARGRGDRAGRVEARRRRPVAARDPATPARCRSRWTRARAGRAGGTRCAPCGCWTGTRPAAETRPAGRIVAEFLQRVGASSDPKSKGFEIPERAPLC